MTTKTRPVTRAEQTLRTLRLIRDTKHTPYARWEILLNMAIHGDDKPMLAEQILALCPSGALAETLRRMEGDGHMLITKQGTRNYYAMTNAGKQELARVIKGAEK